VAASVAFLEDSEEEFVDGGGPSRGSKPQSVEMRRIGRAQVGIKKTADGVGRHAPGLRASRAGARDWLIEGRASCRDTPMWTSAEAASSCDAGWADERRLSWALIH